MSRIKIAEIYDEETNSTEPVYKDYEMYICVKSVSLTINNPKSFIQLRQLRQNYRVIKEGEVFKVVNDDDGYYYTIAFGNDLVNDESAALSITRFNESFIKLSESRLNKLKKLGI